MWEGFCHLLPSGGLSQCLDNVVIDFSGLLIDRQGFGELAFNPLQMWIDIFLQSGMKFRVVFQKSLSWSVKGTILVNSKLQEGLED